jgi:hypothetical protein
LYRIGHLRWINRAVERLGTDGIALAISEYCIGHRIVPDQVQCNFSRQLFQRSPRRLRSSTATTAAAKIPVTFGGATGSESEFAGRDGSGQATGMHKALSIFVSVASSNFRILSRAQAQERKMY